MLFDGKSEQFFRVQCILSDLKSALACSYENILVRFIQGNELADDIITVIPYSTSIEHYQ